MSKVFCDQTGQIQLNRMRMAREAHKNVSEFLLVAGIMAANQTLADRTRFELSDEQWLALQAELDQPVSAKPKLKKLLSKPGLLG